MKKLKNPVILNIMSSCKQNYKVPISFCVASFPQLHLENKSFLIYHFMTFCSMDISQFLYPF